MFIKMKSSTSQALTDITKWLNDNYGSLHDKNGDRWLVCRFDLDKKENKKLNKEILNNGRKRKKRNHK